MKIRAIQVFCGARTGADPAFTQEAQALGKLLAENDIRLVYGGGHVGLMGILADAVLQHGGFVTGVIPDFLLAKELGHKGVQEMLVVNSMHERKIAMMERSDATIALPGGFGTLDELFEVLTTVQLGRMHQPTGLLNVHEYYDGLLTQIRRMNQDALLKDTHKQLLIAAPDAESLLSQLLAYEPHAEEGKWDT